MHYLLCNYLDTYKTKMGTPWFEVLVFQYLIIFCRMGFASLYFWEKTLWWLILYAYTIEPEKAVAILLYLLRNSPTFKQIKTDLEGQKGRTDGLFSQIVAAAFVFEGCHGLSITSIWFCWKNHVTSMIEALYEKWFNSSFHKN